MASLKSFLYGLAPMLDMTGAALYERQRALVSIGALETVPGRGPGSGVPLTANNVAAVIISVLASDSLSDVDRSVLLLCNAPPVDATKYPEVWRDKGRPTFRTEVGRALSGNPSAWHAEKKLANCIRVSRCWRGQIVFNTQSNTFLVSESRHRSGPKTGPISLTAEIEKETLDRIVDFTRGALSQLSEEEEES